MQPIHPSLITEAIEVFVGGFCFTRSFTHPFLGERVGPLWVMRDAPRKRGDYRSEEWVAYKVGAEEFDQIVRSQARGRFVICAIGDNEEEQKALQIGLKVLGYRLINTEPLMIHPLAEIPTFDSPALIERVTTTDVADRLTKAARSRQILPEHFVPGARLRQYSAQMDGELIGWVRSITVDKSTWCSNMYVRPAFRRQGIVRALLSRMLVDDRDAGAQRAVLLASHTGAKLYPVVGYQPIGALLLFTPR